MFPVDRAREEWKPEGSSGQQDKVLLLLRRESSNWTHLSPVSQKKKNWKCALKQHLENMQKWFGAWIVRARLGRDVSMWTIISFLAWSRDSCGISGRAVMASVTFPALVDRPVAWIGTIGSLWTALQVESSSSGAVKAWVPINRHKYWNMKSCRVWQSFLFVLLNYRGTCRTEVQRARNTVPARHTELTLSGLCNSNIGPWIAGYRQNSSLWAIVTLRTGSPCNSICRGGCDCSLHAVITA